MSQVPWSQYFFALGCAGLGVVILVALFASLFRSLSREGFIAVAMVNLLALVGMVAYPYAEIPWFAVLFALAVVNFVLVVLNHKRQTAFADLLEDQLANALLIVSGALKAGRSLEQGFELVERGMPPPISDEFRQILQDQRLGISFEDSLRNFMRRTPSKDYKLFLTATLFQRETGGNLIALYDQIIFAVTERHRLKGRVENLTTQGRMTGYVMMCLPILFLGFLIATDPSRIFALTHTSYGVVALLAPFCLLLIGVIWLWTIVNRKVG